MNTEQVVEMIDAITEGKNYDMVIEGGRESDETKFQFAAESFAISHDTRGYGVTEIEDPRTAREIAGALVAWADRKDGSITQSANRIVGDIRWAEHKETSNLPNGVVDSQASLYRRALGVTDETTPPENCKAPKVWRAIASHRRKHRETGECPTPSVQEWGETKSKDEGS